jgi:hypothetical protein
LRTWLRALSLPARSDSADSQNGIGPSVTGWPSRNSCAAPMPVTFERISNSLVAGPPVLGSPGLV